MILSPWSHSLKVIAGSFHGVAIVCTIFRLTYRCYMARFWWEDGLAAVALVADVVCLASAILEAPAATQVWPPVDDTTNWMAALAFPCVLWACRTSILFSIVRAANPSPQLRRIALFVGCSFIIMWATLLGQRLWICINDHCMIASSVGLSQLITDVISDLALVLLPIYFLGKTRINHRQRIMIFSVFSASLSISVVTIVHSAVLFTVVSNGTIVIAHIKTALSLIVCNLLVIVAFIHCVCRRAESGDLDEDIEFTSIYLNTGLGESGMDKSTTINIQGSTASEGSRWTAVVSIGTIGGTETSSRPTR